MSTVSFFPQSVQVESITAPTVIGPGIVPENRRHIQVHLILPYAIPYQNTFYKPTGAGLQM